MNKTEILAPAGGYDSLVAAVRCGADAVYLGADSFNARKNAQNFDRETLEKSVRYAHLNSVKVYLTLNTLVSDDEMYDLAELICFAAKIGIDAFIVQDLAVAEKAKKYAPEIPLHASTQMSVQTLDGIKLLASSGFSRAVLPRELNKNEILKIAENSPIELEMFIHGALCMSVSGQCYLSAMLGSRSGNRGYCAQPCRLPFSVENGTGHDLSLKDYSLIKYINELAEIGITSFKIEGRMKRPEYVAASVTACKNTLNNNFSNEIYNDLKAVFSRSGFTDGYYRSDLGRNMFGTRQKEDVISADFVLNKLSKLYEKEKQHIPIIFDITIKENLPVILYAKSGKHEVKITSEIIAEKAVKKSLTEDTVTAQLSKCGGTVFYAEKIITDIGENLSLPISELNKLRRSALSSIEEKIIKNNTISVKEKTPTENKILTKNITVKNKETYLYFDNINQIPKNIPEDFKIILPISLPENDFKKIQKNKNEILAEIPRGIFGKDEIITEKICTLKETGIKTFVASTLDAVSVAQKCGVEFIAGFGSNIFNSESTKWWKKSGVQKVLLSPELTSNQIENTENILPVGIICYGKLPLMLCRNCPSKNGKTCAECNKTGKLTDRKGLEFEISCTNYCSEILNPYPIYLFDKKDCFKNVSFFMLRFTKETLEECEKILDKYINNSPPEKSEKYTRGLAFRGVL